MEFIKDSIENIEKHTVSAYTRENGGDIEPCSDPIKRIETENGFVFLIHSLSYPPNLHSLDALFEDRVATEAIDQLERKGYASKEVWFDQILGRICLYSKN